MDAGLELELRLLAAEILAVCQRAAELRQVLVEDHLLHALEELAHTATACEPARDRAYMELIAKHPLS